jgi:hypothetical protein
MGLTGRRLNPALRSRIKSLHGGSLPVVVRKPETDRALRPSGRGDQMSQRLEDLIQLLVVLAEPRSGLSLKLSEPLLVESE